MEEETSPADFSPVGEPTMGRFRCVTAPDGQLRQRWAAAAAATGTMDDAKGAAPIGAEGTSIDNAGWVTVPVRRTRIPVPARARSIRAAATAAAAAGGGSAAATVTVTRRGGEVRALSSASTQRERTVLSGGPPTLDGPASSAADAAANAAAATAAAAAATTLVPRARARGRRGGVRARRQRRQQAFRAMREGRTTYGRGLKLDPVFGSTLAPAGGRWRWTCTEDRRPAARPRLVSTKLWEARECAIRAAAAEAVRRLAREAGQQACSLHCGTSQRHSASAL